MYGTPKRRRSSCSAIYITKKCNQEVQIDFFCCNNLYEGISRAMNPFLPLHSMLARAVETSMIPRTCCYTSIFDRIYYYFFSKMFRAINTKILQLHSFFFFCNPLTNVTNCKIGKQFSKGVKQCKLHAFFFNVKIIISYNWYQKRR